MSPPRRPVSSRDTSALSPCPDAPQGHRGCACASCFGLAEYMLTLTGTTYGLERRTPVQHASPPSPKHRHDCICDDCILERREQRRRQREERERRAAIVQPWETRPARRAA